LTQDDRNGAALGALFIAANIDPAGLDLTGLAKLKAETEAMIADGRRNPAFATALPAFNPLDRLPPVEDGGQ
jgi:hypothetical protein